MCNVHCLFSFSPQNEQEFDSVCQMANFQDFSFRVRAKMDTWQVCVATELHISHVYIMFVHVRILITLMCVALYNHTDCMLSIVPRTSVCLFVSYSNQYFMEE